MMGEPWFWRDNSLTARVITGVLTPFAMIYESASAIKQRITSPVRAEIPVICIGNATMGGVGKTPFALMLTRALQEKGFAPHFLSRGYGGSLRGPVQVDPENHFYTDVGDEALLLAQQAPAWVSRNRPAGAEAAAKAGADLIIMDDGFQNPSLHKDYSILLLGYATQLGNEKVFPAGPMREPLIDAKARAECIVEIGKKYNVSGTGVYAWLEASPGITPKTVFAFCGIGNPDRFFQMLDGLGFEVTQRAAFPDHHPFTRREIESLKRSAKKSGALLITTEKDLMRIAPEQRADIETLPVEMKISNPDAFLAPILVLLAKRESKR